MYLGVYRFAGDPAELLPAYDTCPDRETFERFSTGFDFRGAVAAAGLPEPSIDGAPVHAVRVSSAIATH
jgi:hypothetical protein